MAVHPRNAGRIAGALTLGVVIPAIFWIAQGATAGLITAGWGWMTIAAFYFGGGRSETVRIVGGFGDEPIRSLNVRALAFADYLGRRGG